MRSLLVGMGMAALVVGATACGDDAATTATTAINVTATNYQTLPPTPTTQPVPTTAPDAPGAVTQFETEYVVAPGDYPATIARAWKVSLEALMAANGWTLQGTGNNAYIPEFPGAGAVIKIPAGATVPGIPAPGTETTVAGGGAPTATTAPPAATTTAAPTTTAAAGETCGVYTILPEDTSRIKVANKFNTTVEKLDAANAATRGYSSFYPGLEIKLPC